MQIQLNTNNFSPGIQSDASLPQVKSVPIDLPVKQAETTPAAADPQALQQALGKINQTMQELGNNLQFSVDSETSVHIVKVVDRGTNQTIRQFPSEETLAIAKTLDKLQGLLIRVKA